jgi:hypothetical protein
MLKGGDDVLRCCREITKRENEADEITREVMTALRKTFVTPLDRGDIKDLITSMDDSIDQMNQVAKVITLFELRSFEEHMQEMGDIIVQAGQLMMDAVPLLSSLGRHSARLNLNGGRALREIGRSLLTLPSRVRRVWTTSIFSEKRPDRLHNAEAHVSVYLARFAVPSCVQKTFRPWS